MNYIYDIYLNFNKDLYDFFDWNKNDKLIHIQMIPIFKTTEENIKRIINYNIEFKKEFLENIINKSITWNKLKKNYVLFCDENNVIGIEVDSEGKSINKSSLLIYEELEILENAYKLKIRNIEFKTLNKNKLILKTRKQIKDEAFIKSELKNIDNDKLNYIYFECFNKHEKNKNKIMNNLLNLSKNSKTYKILYNILKLTSTTTK